MTLIKRMMAAVLLLVLVACDAAMPSNRLPETPLGLQAIFRFKGQEHFLEVISAEDFHANIAYFWRGKQYASTRYYRGLFPVTGTQDNARYDIDVDTSHIDALFPLAVDKEASFGGTFVKDTTGAVADIWVHMSVLKETKMTMKDTSYQVFVIEIQTQFRYGDTGTTTKNTVYYAPDIGLILKSVIHENNNKFEWRVTSVELPDTQDTSVRRRRNNRGTVMI